MEWNEWCRLAQTRIALWPRMQAADEGALRIEHEFLKATPYEAGFAALKSMASREFPPNAAMIAETALALVSPPEPDFDQVAAEFKRMVIRDAGRWDARCSPTPEAWERHGVHPRIAEYFTGERWRLWCSVDLSDTTFYAQQRDEYRMGRSRYESNQRLIAAGVDRPRLEKGLHRLELPEGPA